MTMAKRAKKPTKKQTKAVKKAAPTSISTVAAKTVAEHYICNEMWEAVDRSIYMHGLEPIDNDAYGEMQLEAGKITRIDDLTIELYEAMEHYANLTRDEMKMHIPLEAALQEIYDEFADDIIHLFWDPEDEETDQVYLQSVGINRYSLDQEERIELFHKEHEAKKEEFENEIVKKVQAAIAKEAIDKEEPIKEEKHSALSSLAMFGGAILGAGIANAAMSNSGVGSVRVSDAASDDVVSDVVEQARNVSNS